VYLEKRRKREKGEKRKKLIQEDILMIMFNFEIKNKISNLIKSENYKIKKLQN